MILLQVPLLWTAYAQLSFRDFVGLDMQSPAGQASFFELPSDYTPRTLDDVVAARGKRVAERHSISPTEGLSASDGAALRDLDLDGGKFEL